MSFADLRLTFRSYWSPQTGYSALPEIPATLSAQVDTLTEKAFKELHQDLESFFKQVGHECDDLLTLPTQAEFKAFCEKFNAATWVKQLAATSQPAPSEGPSRSHRNLQRTHIIIHFFPNLGHVLMGTFSLFDAARPPDTLYEYGVLISIYKQLFDILRKFVQGINGFTGSALKTFLVSSSVFGVSLGIFYSYLRWQKGCPQKIDHCTLLDAPKTDGEDEALSYRRVIFIGPPGVGKSKRLQELASKIRDKKVFQFVNGPLFGTCSPGTSVAQKMWDAFKQASGWEDRLVFFCDEFGDAYKENSTSIALCLKPFSDDSKTHFIGVMTLEQWQQFKKDDASLASRFHIICLKPMDEAQTEKVIHEVIRKDAPHLPLSPEIQKHIVQVTNENRPDCHQPRKALMLLERILEDWKHLDAMEPTDLKIQRQKLKELQLSAPVWEVGTATYSMHMDSIAIAKAALDELEKTYASLKQDQRILSAAIRIENGLKIQIIRDAQGRPDPLKLAYRQFFVSRLATKIQGQIARLDSKLFRFDKDYIHRIYTILEAEQLKVG